MAQGAMCVAQIQLLRTDKRLQRQCVDEQHAIAVSNQKVIQQRTLSWPPWYRKAVRHPLVQRPYHNRAA